MGKPQQKGCYSNGNQGLAPSREEEEEEEEGCGLLTNKKIAGRLWIGKRMEEGEALSGTYKAQVDAGRGRTRENKTLCW